MNSKISDNLQNVAKIQTGDAKDVSQNLNYTEIPGLTDPGLDVLNQLNMNLKMLGDLHQRLHFTIREIKTVIR